MPTLAQHVIAQVVLPRVSGLPEDVVTNTFHFNRNITPYVDAAPLIHAALVNFYNDLTVPASTFPICTFINDQISRTSGACETRIYDGSVAPNLRTPTITTWTLGAVGNTTSYPAEVAACLSFKNTVSVGTPEPRRRGRVFIGPLNSDAVGAESAGDPRPDSTFVSRLLDAGERLHDDLAPDIAWVVYSPSGNFMLPVTDLWVDNAFDTQRRRGAKATARTSRSI